MDFWILGFVITGCIMPVTFALGLLAIVAMVCAYCIVNHEKSDVFENIVWTYGIGVLVTFIMSKWWFGITDKKMVIFLMFCQPLLGATSCWIVPAFVKLIKEQKRKN